MPRKYSLLFCFFSFRLAHGSSYQVTKPHISTTPCESSQKISLFICRFVAITSDLVLFEHGSCHPVVILHISPLLVKTERIKQYIYRFVSLTFCPIVYLWAHFAIRAVISHVVPGNIKLLVWHLLCRKVWSA